MKRRIGIVLMACVFVLSFSKTGLSQEYYRIFLELGAFHMEASGHYLIYPVFQEIVNRHPHDARTAARAQLYLALCYKRLGSDKALGAFQKVITTYSQQADIVKIAEEEMASLSTTSTSTTDEPEDPAKRLFWEGSSVYGTADMSDDGRCLSYVDRESGDIMFYEEGSRKSIRLIDCDSTVQDQGCVIHATVSPDGARVAYGWRNRAGEGELRVVSADGSGIRHLLNLGKGFSICPTDWSPDGGQILAVAASDNFATRIIGVALSDGSIQMAMDMGQDWPHEMKISPDGRYLACSILRGNAIPEHDLYIFNIREQKKIPLVTQPGNDQFLGWTPNGKILLLSNRSDQEAEISVVSLQENQVTASRRPILSGFGEINPIGLTANGTFFFERSRTKDMTLPLYENKTEILALRGFLPEAGRILTVPDECLTIQAAIDEAYPGDTVFVRKGHYRENIVIDKSLILSGEDRARTHIDGGGERNSVDITASHVQVQGFTVTNGIHGFLITNLPIHHVILRDLIVTRNKQCGIYSNLTGGYHLVEDCIFSHNGADGIAAHHFSRSIIRNCEVFGNANGIRPGWDWYVTLEGNNVHHNVYWGICLDSCYHGKVINNLVHSNKTGIIYQYVASRNTVQNNIIMNNEAGIENGLYWGGFGENKIYHNDFVDNERSYLLTRKNSSAFQLWDSGIPGGGNFWSDHSGEDKNDDGTADYPYPLENDAVDNYPLMKPWNRIRAVVEILPGRIHLENKRGWIVIHIGLPARLSPETIEVSSLELNGKPVISSARIEIGDINSEGNRFLILTFSRKKIIQMLKPGDINEIVITGNLKNGLRFEGKALLDIVER